MKEKVDEIQHPHATEDYDNKRVVSEALPVPIPSNQFVWSRFDEQYATERLLTRHCSIVIQDLDGWKGLFVLMKVLFNFKSLPTVLSVNKIWKKTNIELNK
ncbi:hypothetical protein C0J52_23546 [Blattella germanica]|nr:hypothetical protein C0J52_23546 [Blattella germanica]